MLPRRVLVRWCSAVPSSLPLGMEELRVRELALEVQNRLRVGGKDMVSRKEYLRVGGDVGMTRKDAEALLVDLQGSGGVFVSDETIYLTPLKLFNEVNKQYGLPAFDPCPELTNRLAELKTEFASISATKSLADEDVARRRLRLWAAVTAASGLQMCGFAFLTFPSLSGDLCLGWDVIEPICFFVMQAYVVGWFGYFFLTKREHTLTAWDERHFYKMSEKAYKRRGVDIPRWVELKKQIQELELKQREYHIALD